VAAIVLAAGCTSDVSTDDFDYQQVRRQPIMGGTTDNDHTSVVGILINLNGGQAICSGTLIAPNLVLTAQHCVAELNSQFVICGQTPFGSTHAPSSFGVTTLTTLSQNGSDYRSVDAVHVPPGTNDTCGFDIALLELSENVPSTETEPIGPRLDGPIETGETAPAVGYGHVGDGPGAGTRRQLGGRQVLCGTGECSINDGIESAEFAGTDGTCQGDSGGAALDSEGRVLGALSRGPDGCAGSVYSAVDAWASWLREIGQTAATNGGYTAPVWVTEGISDVPDDDPDLDGILNPNDNCPQVPNDVQADLDGDGVGDECDDDVDGDGSINDVDNCPLYANPEQYDNDNDTFGDVCDPDDDDDGVMDTADNCQFMPNVSQNDVCNGNPTFGSGSGAATDPGSEDPRVVIVDDEQPQSIHMTGAACAGAASPGDMAGFLFLFPALFGLRRRRWVR
jgi:hypothetical protein